MWTGSIAEQMLSNGADTLNGVSGLIGALAAFIVALTGLGGILVKVTRSGKSKNDTVPSGVEVPQAFDYPAEWRKEKDRADRLDEENDAKAATIDALRSRTHALELVLARNNIPF